MLDDVDIAHLSKPLLAEHMGYVQQDGRLFAGTLRDNLILGQLDPGDEAIMQAARDTGLVGDYNQLESGSFKKAQALDHTRQQADLFHAREIMNLFDQHAVAVEEDGWPVGLNGIKHGMAP